MFADGSVHAISNAIDRALYMFVVTRNGGDPVPSVESAIVLVDPAITV